ncbi:MAG TPA: molybdopterin molybdotransferase MoeA [Candidatus Baltobacteraceae bacterium]
MQPANPLLPFGFRTEQLLAPAQALAVFAASARLAPPRVERVALDEAFDRVLAANVRADRAYPDAARSTMDGYALASSQTPGRLQVAGEVLMGATWGGALAPRTCVAIPTGGVLPEGTDAVVPIEDARAEGGWIDVPAAVPRGEFVTPCGSDMRADETVLRVGRRLGAPELGVLATVGAVEVEVFAKPRIAVISTGDELVDAAGLPGPGQIRDSNRHAIAASLRAMGVVPVIRPIVSDTPGALEDALRTSLATCDGAVLSGGSSVGPRDRTPGAIAALGLPGVLVHGLRVRPGKPTVLAAIGGKPVIGLPGNPTSALMILEAVAAPIVAALTGAAPAQAAEVCAVAAAEIVGREGWTAYLPVALENEGGRLLAHPLTLRSAHVSLPARAAGYVIVGERPDRIDVGQPARVRRFLSGGDRTA